MKYSNAKSTGSFQRSYTKLSGLHSIFFVLICSFSLFAAKEQDPLTSSSLPAILVGAERFDQYVSELNGKRVGIVGNQTSVVGNGVHLVDTLLKQGVRVVRLFSPEHGFRGKADAGELVNGDVDTKTGLTIVSLYGTNKKPTKEQLQGIDVLLFDIQDVGVRFYTYISTLHLVMEACAEQGVSLLVLDRPNPNGHYVDGPVLQKEFVSFVGMHPVPVIHGMTIGEYAKMINGELWLKGGVQCSLQVMECLGYTHATPYSLPIPPSPNLRSDVSIQLYPSLCFFEATTVSIGRGTDGPFERYGHPDFPETDFMFTPESMTGAKNPKHKGTMCYGYNLSDPNYRADRLELRYLIHARELLAEKPFVDREDFFNLLAGNNSLIEQLHRKVPEEDIRKTWEEDLVEFKQIRAKYLIYP